jgi:hypothetical protein
MLKHANAPAPSASELIGTITCATTEVTPTTTIAAANTPNVGDAAARARAAAVISSVVVIRRRHPALLRVFRVRFDGGF